MDIYNIEAADRTRLLLLDIKKLEKIHFDFDDDIDSTKAILEAEHMENVLELAKFNRTKLNIEIEIDYILKIKNQAEELLEYLEQQKQR